MVQMEVCLPIEMEGRFGEYYPAVITGLNSLDEYKVSLLDSTYSVVVKDLVLPPTSLRLPQENLEPDFEPVVGQEVDVLIKNKLGRHISEKQSGSLILSSWWPGVVKRSGGGFAIVELSISCENDITESEDNDIFVLLNGRVSVVGSKLSENIDIFEKHQLRPRSQYLNLTRSSFHVHPINISNELALYCREPSHYCHFARRCGKPVLICLAPESLRLNTDTIDSTPSPRLLVISTNIDTIHRASLIDKTFVEMLRQKVSILEQTEELSKKLEANRLNQSTTFSESFFIPIQMIPHAIGAHESNIQTVRTMNGIEDVELDRNNGYIQISGKTQESVNNARDLLEFSQKVIHVPSLYVGHILGSGYRNLQQIVDQVSLISIRISKLPNTEPSNLENPYVAFQLMGCRKAIRDTRMFLDFLVKGLQEMDRLKGMENVLSIYDPQSSTNDNIDRTRTTTAVTTSDENDSMENGVDVHKNYPVFNGSRNFHPRSFNHQRSNQLNKKRTSHFNNKFNVNNSFVKDELVHDQVNKVLNNNKQPKNTTLNNSNRSFQSISNDRKPSKSKEFGLNIRNFSKHMNYTRRSGNQALSSRQLDTNQSTVSVTLST